MVSTYSPKLVTISWMGILFGGYADGSFIKVKRRQETFMLKVGSDGFAARSAMSDQSGEIVVDLMQTSGTNDLLSAAAILDEQTQAAYGPFLMKDLRGRTVCAAPYAWIKKIADLDMEREAKERSWTFETDVLQQFVGGNL